MENSPQELVISQEGETQAKTSRFSCASPSLRYVYDQIQSLKQTIRNKDAFDTNYNDITESIIPSINTQLKLYQKGSYKAIKKEILEETIKNIKIDDWKAKIKQDFNAKTFPSPLTDEIKLPSMDIDLTLIENSYFDELYMQLTETDKKYAKAGLEVDAHLTEVIEDLVNFERQLCQYRDDAIRYFISKVPYLVDSYELEVLRIAQKQPHKQTFQLNHKVVIPFPLHLDEFIHGCISGLL